MEEKRVRLQKRHPSLFFASVFRRTEASARGIKGPGSAHLSHVTLSSCSPRFRLVLTSALKRGRKQKTKHNSLLVG